MSVTRLSNAKGWLSHGMWSRGVWQRGRLRWAHVAMYIGGGAQAGTDNEFFRIRPRSPQPRGVIDVHSNSHHHQLWRAVRRAASPVR